MDGDADSDVAEVSPMTHAASVAVRPFLSEAEKVALEHELLGFETQPSPSQPLSDPEQPTASALVPEVAPELELQSEGLVLLEDDDENDGMAVYCDSDVDDESTVDLKVLEELAMTDVESDDDEAADVVSPEDLHEPYYSLRDQNAIREQLKLSAELDDDSPELESLTSFFYWKLLDTTANDVKPAEIVLMLAPPLLRGLLDKEIAEFTARRHPSVMMASVASKRRNKQSRRTIDKAKCPFIICKGCDDLHCLTDPLNAVYICSIDRMRNVFEDEHERVAMSFFVKHKLFEPERCTRGECQDIINADGKRGSLGGALKYLTTCVVRRCSGSRRSPHNVQLGQETPFRTPSCKIDMAQLMVLMYSFCCRDASKTAAKAANLAQRTASHWYSIICRVMAAAHNAKIAKAEGARFLQVDETFFGTRKNHKGARVRRVTFWVMTISEMSEPDANGKMKVLNTYLYPLPHRHRQRGFLLPIIARHCTVGETQLVTDGGKWYSNCGELLGVEHQIVIHNGPKACFKNADGAHTNGAEGVHGAVKRVAKKVFNGYGKSARVAIRRAMTNAEFINITDPLERLRKLIRCWREVGTSAMLKNDYVEDFIPDEEAFSAPTKPFHEATKLAFDEHLIPLDQGTPHKSGFTSGSTQQETPQKPSGYALLSPEELFAKCNLSATSFFRIAGITQEQYSYLRSAGEERGWRVVSEGSTDGRHFNVSVDKNGGRLASESSFNPSRTPQRVRSATPIFGTPVVRQLPRDSPSTKISAPSKGVVFAHGDKNKSISGTTEMSRTTNISGIPSMSGTTNIFYGDQNFTTNNYAVPNQITATAQPRQLSPNDDVVQSCEPGEMILSDAIIAVLNEMQPFAEHAGVSFFQPHYAAYGQPSALPAAGVLHFNDHYIAVHVKVELMGLQSGSGAPVAFNQLTLTIADSAPAHNPKAKQAAINLLLDTLVEKKLISEAQRSEHRVENETIGRVGVNDCGVIALRSIRNAWARGYPAITRVVIRDAYLRSKRNEPLQMGRAPSPSPVDHESGLASKRKRK